MTLIGNRPEWVAALLACFRIGAVALPCIEQLRAGDLRAANGRRRARARDGGRGRRRHRARGWLRRPAARRPDERLFDAAARPGRGARLHSDPALIVFTSGTAGEPKPIRHGQRYLFGQRVQAEHWFGPARGRAGVVHGGERLVEVGAQHASSPRGCAARPRCSTTRRFDAEERLELIEREGVDVLCMAPTEYRAIAKRAALRPLPSLRHAVAAGEPLNPEVVRVWEETAGVSVHDGYGQTETGALTGMPSARPCAPGSMGRPLPGFRHVGRGRRAVRGPRHACPRSSSTARAGTWRTGDRVRQDDDGYLWFEGRTDDVIISAGYRIGPFEVESALVSHPAVAEAAAVGAPDEERGQVVRAVVVLRDGVAPGEALARAAAGARQGAAPPRTSTRAWWSSPTRCPRRPAARSGARSSGPRAPDAHLALRLDGDVADVARMRGSGRIRGRGRHRPVARSTRYSRVRPFLRSDAYAVLATALPPSIFENTSKPTTLLVRTPSSPTVFRTPSLGGFCNASESRPESIANSIVPVVPGVGGAGGTTISSESLLMYAEPTTDGSAPALASIAA